MRRDGTPSPGALRPPVHLLVTAGVAAGALATAAVLATGAYRTAVDRSMGRYAGIAAWQLAEHTREALDEALERTLWPVRRFGVVGDDGFPPVTALADYVPDPRDCPCPLALSVRFYVRMDLRTGEMETSGERLDPDRASALRLALGGTERPPSRVSDAPSLAMWFHGLDTMFLATTVLPDRDGRPAAVYGAAVPPSAVGPVLANAMAGAELLPASVLPDAAQEELFLARVVDRAGRTLFGSGEGAPSEYRATFELGDALAGIQGELFLSEGATEGLTPGSAAPPWMLGSLLVATLALLWTAFRSLATERRLLAARERLLATLSHDLRTPLAQIRLCAETLRMGRARSDREQASYIERVDIEARRLAHTVENALLVGRGAQAMPAPEPVDVVALARAEADRYADLAPSTPLRVRGPDTAWASARPDPLRRILANLIDNAVKYGPPGEPVEVRVEEDGRWIGLRVLDRGPGIAPDDRDRVFEPFVRLPGASDVATGSGMGLAVVRDLVRGLGGAVGIEGGEGEGGAPGSGTTFVVELPAAEAPATARGGRGRSEERSGPGRATGRDDARVRAPGGGP